MGNEPSVTRRVTFTREEFGTIAVSDGVAQRLERQSAVNRNSSTVNSVSGSSVGIVEPKPEIPRNEFPSVNLDVPPDSDGNLENIDVAKSAKEPILGDSHDSDQEKSRQHKPSQQFVDTRFSTVYSLPYVTEKQRARNLKDAGLAAEKIWKAPFEDLQQKQDLLTQKAANEFSQSASRVEKVINMGSLPSNPCSRLQQAVLSCYKQNQGRTLLCGEKVRSFVNCVDENRKAILSIKTI